MLRQKHRFRYRNADLCRKGKVKEFIGNELFNCQVNLNDANILRNLSELEAVKTIVETFKKEINNLTVQDVGDTEIKNYL